MKKTRGSGADARRKEARAAKSEKARRAADQEEATVIWNAHYDEMEALGIANKNLTEEIEACRAHTDVIRRRTNGLEFEAAAQRALLEEVREEQNEEEVLGHEWETATYRQRHTIETLRQELRQAHQDIMCEEERYARDKCEVHFYRDELDARRTQESRVLAEANHAEFTAQHVRFQLARSEAPEVTQEDVPMLEDVEDLLGQ